MIAILNGQVVEMLRRQPGGGRGRGWAAGVCADSVARRLRPGDEVFLHTYLVVRQDALSLYGFESREERELFILLLGVDGVGPKSALAVLSALSPDAIRRAVFHEQPDVFSRVPGVGKKTGPENPAPAAGSHPSDDRPGKAAAISDVDSEVLGALTALGYSVVEAQAALQSIPRDTPEMSKPACALPCNIFL